MNTYRVSNNTDYKVPFVTNNRREAVRVWMKYVRSRPGAGNAYSGDIEQLVAGTPGESSAIWESIAEDV